MQLITVSGPHAAGKESVITELLQALPLARVVAHTSRKPRACEQEGKEYYFISPRRFSSLVEQGAFVEFARIHEHCSGVLRNELFRNRFAVTDITPKGARKLRKEVRRKGGKVFCIFLYASEKERRERIRRRQPALTQEEIGTMLKNDPVDADPKFYPDFDLVLKNPNGRFKKTLWRIILEVAAFLANK